MTFQCCDRLRRNATATHPTLNGLDYLEVLDRELPDTHAFRQRTLLLHFLKPFPSFTRDNLRITGGDRIANVTVEWADGAQPLPGELTPEEAAIVSALPDANRVLVIRTASAGDRSTYHLHLVRSPQDDRPPDTIDPQLAEIAFSFKVECPSDFDCVPISDCPPEEYVAPEINYLAKDYPSFRRLLLDRLRQLVPDWQPRGPADQGIAIAELLAYVGDHLSYQQDAAATEAYIGTARKRVSLRRHAVLVDYAMHDGCNARVWVQLTVSASFTLTKAGTQFLTQCAGTPAVLAPASSQLARAMLLRPLVFEPLHDVAVDPAHERISLYTWGDRRCCLPKGSTRATLTGAFPNLQPGAYLLFEEVLGPETGIAGDADPAHRHVVRVTVVHRLDPANNPLVDPLNQQAITEIEWAQDDALPFPVCVSSVTDDAHGNESLEDVTVIRGNLVLADHGRTVSGESLGAVPEPTLFRRREASSCRCDEVEPEAVPPRFRPSLAEVPLTHAGGVWIELQQNGERRRERVAFDQSAPASHAMRWEMADVWPEIRLNGTFKTETTPWAPRRTLLKSGASAPEFVVEIEEDQTARVRFGDDRLGRRPESGTTFVATYRVGNGRAGNIGADAIAHIVTSDAVTAVRNPMPAVGGVDPESAASVRRRAPQAFRRQERAVTTDDYEEVTLRQSGIQNAAASLRWTGSWHTVFITVDRAAGLSLTPQFTKPLERHVDRYRMAGHDVTFREPKYVPLELALHVCVKDGWFRSEVKKALTERFSSRVLRDGRRGLFHPDNFTFGQPVYLSRIYAEAHAVPGVDSVEITAFRRQYSQDTVSLAEGRITLGRLEIPRLDNDPNFPERGVLSLDLHGGK